MAFNGPSASTPSLLSMAIDAETGPPAGSPGLYTCHPLSIVAEKSTSKVLLFTCFFSTLKRTGFDIMPCADAAADNSVAIVASISNLVFIIIFFFYCPSTFESQLSLSSSTTFGPLTLSAFCSPERISMLTPSLRPVTTFFRSYFLLLPSPFTT